jgi:MoaA/NifB/PqqE/SkfB family radical SAM enzyme
MGDLCASIPSETFMALNQRLLQAAGTRRIALSLDVEFTRRCNVRCSHCYLPETHGSGPDGVPELTGDEIKRVLNESADMGVMWLLITGGEPLVRPDFVELYQYAKRLGFLITLFTNGTLVTEEIADLLAEEPPSSVEITVHSMDRAVFESVSRVPGSFDQCMAGIRRLHERRLRLLLKTVALRENVAGLYDVRAFSDSLGLRWHYDPHVMRCMDGGASPLEDEADPEVLDGWLALHERVGGPRPGRVFPCGAGGRSFHVNAYGRMAACLMTEYMSYDLRRGTVREGWCEFIPGVVDRPAGADYACGNCDISVLCSRCPGRSHIETGNELSPVDYCCELGSMRAEAVGRHRERKQRHAVSEGEPALR